MNNTEAPTPDSTDNAAPDVVIREIIRCASSWVPDARLVGNVRAGDIRRALEYAISRAEPAMTTRRFEMNATVKLLNKYEISYTTDENGKITVGGSLDLNGLTSIPEGFNPTVGGYLYLSGLTSIPEGFNPTVGGSLYLSGLTSIPEGFNPTVGGYLYLNVKLKEKTKPLPEDFRFQLSLKIEAKFNLRGFTFADNILARILSKRGNAKKVQVVGKKESSWLVSDGEGNNAHGDTLKKATEELRFKTASRDVEQFRGMNKGTRKTPQEWAFVYRAITGACQSGTAHFMGKHTLKKTYTLQEIIDQTRGAFGHERFVEVTK